MIVSQNVQILGISINVKSLFEFHSSIEEMQLLIM